MKLGLLKADYVNEEFKAIDGDLPDIFRSFFEKAGDVSMDVFDLIHDEFPPDDYRCDAFVITGSRNAAYDDIPWVERLRSFIRRGVLGHARFVGFCFGHQVLAEALGGCVARSGRGWNVGVRPLALRQRAAWMRPSKGTLRLLFNHRDHVVERPPGSTLLAGDEGCPVQMFTLGGQVLGLQAHPEYSIRYQEALMSVAGGMTPDVLEDARRRNRAEVPDDRVALQWICRFITS